MGVDCAFATDSSTAAGRSSPGATFLLAGGLSTAFALDSRLAFFGDFEQGVGFGVFALCTLAGFLVTQLVRDSSRLRELTSAVVFTATAVALVGLLQQVLYLDLLGIGNGSLPEWIVQRGYGTIGNPDTYAAYLVLPALLALHRLRRSTTSEDRAMWSAATLALLMSCIMAQTRGPLLGLMVGGVAYGISEYRTARRTAAGSRGSKIDARTSPVVPFALVAAAIIGGIVATGIFGTALDFGTRFGSIKSLVSLGGRAPLWSNALEIAQAHPLFGVGVDSFRLGWYPVRDIAQLAGGAGLVITDPHSVPLLILATMGVAGLLAAMYLLGSALVVGARTVPQARTKETGSDYAAWFYGTVAVSITLLSSMLTSIMLFMLFIALGVLVAPSLRERRLPAKAIQPLVVSSMLLSIALLAFALLTSVAQVTAVGARTADAQRAATQARRAASIAPWDTEIRNLEHETLVQAALESVFTDRADASHQVDAADDALASASRAAPHEYLIPYRSALLLIASGQQLDVLYTQRGIEAGLKGLAVYPNSLELRTGVASGYLQLGKPEEAELMLHDVWAADPLYLPSGLTYVEALQSQAKTDEARASLTLLRERFPEDPSLARLEEQLVSDQQP